MEIFVDFGLFELLAVLGLAALTRSVYSRRSLGIGFLTVSVAIPAALLVLTSDSLQRCMSGLCLVTALVNAAAIVTVLEPSGLPRLKHPVRRTSVRRDDSNDGIHGSA